MKKIFLTIIAVAFIILTGCEDGLDPQLYGTLSPTTFPSNEQEYELYMLELYKPFLSNWGYQEPGTDWTNSFFSPERGHIVMLDLPSDIFTVFTLWGGFWEGQSSANFEYMLNEDRYQSHFDKIRLVTRATKIIGDIENSDLLQSVKDRFAAEARVSRAWIMSFLLNYYGPVPVIVDYAKVGDVKAENNLTKPSREFFVNSIASDLRFAADHLENHPAEYGRFNKGLALTLLMRLYMNEKDFTNAESVGREITGLGYGLVDDYSSLFREATEKNNETIWAVSCSEGEETKNFNPIAFYCYPDDYAGVKVTTGGWGDGVFMVTWDFYDSFDTLDERRLFVTEYTRIASTVRAGQDRVRTRTSNPALRGPVCKKYLDEGNTTGSFRGNDVVIARYADVMLMLAEAINNNNSGPTSEAIQLVNDVRERAGIGPLAANDIASQQTFNDAILRERGWELYLEGLRKPDLIRHGKWPVALEAVSGKNSNAPVLCPIPTYAIINSNGTLEQNPGY